MATEARTLFASAQVAVLATVRPGGAPHLVPVVFAVVHDIVYTAVDTKRKSTQRLRRLANIDDNAHVALLVDHYDDDWERLWWARADGEAEIHDHGEEMAAGFAALRAKYAQYERISLTGPVVTISVARWSFWRA